MFESEELFFLLLQNGADPTATTDRGTSVLHLLMKRGLASWADEAEKNVKERDRAAFVNQPTRYGWTPLMSAVENAQPEGVAWLLKRDARVNLAMDTGWTAMHAAAKNDDARILRLLLERGGNKNMKAVHRDFGKNLRVEDVTADPDTLALLREYKR